MISQTRTRTKNIKRYQKGGSGSSKNNNNLEARLVRLKLPNVPSNNIELPPHYKLPDFTYYINDLRNIEDNKILGGQIVSSIILALTEFTRIHDNIVYDIIHKFNMIISNIIQKTDELFVFKQKNMKKPETYRIIEGWITLFYRLKIILLDEIDKLKTIK
jgi:hypothetical protein